MGVMNKFMNFLGLQEEEEIVERERVVEAQEEVETPVQEPRKSSKGNIVSIHSQKNVRVILHEPRSYEETQEIADHLRSRRPVVVNLQRIRSDQATRIVDFISGTVYALNGSISKIGPNIFLCTPDTVEIHGSISEILNHEG
ncbi:cell division protein SepF [Paenibacillus mucilaginosus]|uniref:Cell division protein SepF n=2 Tax=Paenibacillus mucilaginosus TaxID=61624 RepID=I0BQ46_9BACL|nr:cell division protein SepF [Paenibacillus mucilaginosus]AEI42585.1 cell division protein sepF [Paenibacillus mucilaginosus KNP414]AFH64493.1 cell division protein SepF [Paenibacillus mucilaginosus K02]MCG7213975.1 cell division protein SepF [Paenibacillus mucilaginosus]WDM25976.1 cell division protein SepF [Paenibacillus mucilaginosus]WFA20691.1 cell division protein SepF [Paenibacillus mucilaginosus]